MNPHFPAWRIWKRSQRAMLSTRGFSSPRVLGIIAPMSSIKMGMGNRRDFIRKSAVGAAGLLGLGLSGTLDAVPPITRPGSPRLMISLAAYSFRDQFAGHGPGPAMDMTRFIQYCAQLGIPGAELTSYYFADTRREAFLEVRRQAFLHGVSISGTAVGNSFTEEAGEKRDREIASVKQWIDRASWMGAPHIRVFAGNRGSLTEEQARTNCIQALEECADYAGKHGIFLGIENHGGIVSKPEQLISIIRDVRSPWVGINLDTGNFHTEDPYRAVAMCAPWAVNVQLKVEVRPSGKPVEKTDMSRIVKILRDVNYQGWVVLEHEKAENPWETIPGYLEHLSDVINHLG